MESAGFRSVVINFTQLNSDEAGQLARLAEEHPYSQLIHLLRARSARDLKLSDAEDRLHQAAVYSTDRAVLKQIMTAPAVARNEEIKTELPPEKTIIDPTPMEVTVEPPKITTRKATDPAKQPETQPANTELSGDALRNDIYTQLEKLKKSKHDFEESVEAFSHGGFAPSKPPAPRVNKEPIDPLLDEIKSTKKKMPVQNPKAQEQNEIIEEFIRKEPVLPKPVVNAEAKDLAEDSGLFSDNIVSETLVEILLKQGKKEKAIEVLKKLIWKFPQKKAYFAAQIESLKG